MRFLFAWQHVEPSSRLSGLDGLRTIVATLDGFELAATAWERAVLPARMDRYEPAMLDMLCLTGEVGWARLSPPRPEQGTSARAARAARRRDADRVVSSRARRPLAGAAPERRRRLQRCAECGRARAPRNASLPRRVVSSRAGPGGRDGRAEDGCPAAPPRVVAAIGELVAAGLVASDGFAGLRTIVKAASGRRPLRNGAAHSGRWSLLRAEQAAVPREVAVEAQAWALLRRYGVVFRRLLLREANAAPWRELARVYRRLEARGEIRGGRFVSGMSGEQFALADAVDRLREIRRTPADGRLIVISAADPLNLAGIVTAGDRVRGAASSRVAYVNGVPVAALEGDYIRTLAEIDPSISAGLATALAGRRLPAVTAGYVGRRAEQRVGRDSTPLISRSIALLRFSPAQIRRYYDRNTSTFVALGQGGSVGAIHRAVWGPGVTVREDAFHFVEDRIAERIKLIGELSPAVHVVDLGCGVGASLCYLAEKLPISGTGITLSPVQARLAAERIRLAGLADRIACVEGDYNDLPAGMRRADLAYAIESFVHGPSPERFFAQCRELVRPGGLLDHLRRLQTCDRGSRGRTRDRAVLPRMAHQYPDRLRASCRRSRGTQGSSMNRRSTCRNTSSCGVRAIARSPRSPRSSAGSRGSPRASRRCWAAALFSSASSADGSDTTLWCFGGSLEIRSTGRWASIWYYNGVKTTIDKAGRVVIPATVRERAGLVPGTELEVTLEDSRIRLERVAPGPRLVKVGRRLVARPTAIAETRPAVDIAALVEEERNRWP